MAVEIAHDARRRVAVMYCNTTDTAFGPIFTGPSAYEDAEEFIEWLGARGSTLRPNDAKWIMIGDGRDPRDWTPNGLEWLVAKWRTENGVTV